MSGLCSLSLENTDILERILESEDLGNHEDFLEEEL